MHAEPLVSVILPAYGRLEHLRACVASVLGQSLTTWELIIADDGSDDATRAWLAGIGDPRVRVLLLPHSGNPARVRNAALRVARGRYLAFLDSDDLWLPEKLERQLAAMSAAPARRWSYSRVQRIDAQGAPASEAGVQDWRRIEGAIVEPLLKIEALVATPAVVAERSLVEEAQGFDEGQQFCEDYDLWIRLALRSEATAVDQPLACVRVHDSNYSQDRSGAHAGWVRLYAKQSRLVGTPRLRALCRRQQARSGLALAASLGSRGEGRAARRAFAAAARVGWPYPRWWASALRTFGGLLWPRARTERGG